MACSPTPIPVVAGVDRQMFDHDIAPAGRPVVMRGLVADWPIVQAARHAPTSLAAYLLGFDRGGPVSIMCGAPGGDGYYFYDPSLDGFNFQRLDAPLPQVVSALLQAMEHASPMPIYAGPILADSATTAFADRNPMPLLDGAARPRLWLSNASRVATHYDVSRNIACCVAGTRRFTVFPPDQVANLYMGPVEHNMAGPPVSMVDLKHPDYDRFPRFREAEAAAMFADLEPGDAIYLPTLWWHHVESFGAFNLLANHWWKAEHAGPDFEGMMIAMVGIRDQPAPERAAWQAFFEHFVFGDDAASAAAHLPPRWRTVTGPVSPERERMILQFITGQLVQRLDKGAAGN